MMANVTDKKAVSPRATGSSASHVAEYDVLRVIVTLLVVLGHATYVSHVTKYGGCDYSVFFSGASLFQRCVSSLSGLIYLFHMPLFMALSGALFYRSFEKGKYMSFKALVLEKGRRLLIPYFIVGVLYSFPLKYFSGYYAGSEHLFRDLIMGQVLIRDDTHLWFLLVLFCIFIVAYLLETFWPGHVYWKLGLMFCAYAANRLIGWRSQSIMEMTFWFYLGFWFEPRRTNILPGGGTLEALICRLRSIRPYSGIEVYS